jgi:hypothetical protein
MRDESRAESGGGRAEERASLIPHLSSLIALAAFTIALGALGPSALCRGQANLPAIDDARAAAAGVRKLPGKRLTLYTDLSGAEIDVLPAVFEQAFPQWCAYFHVDESQHADWHMTGFLIKDRRRFAEAGLLPSNLPPFEHAYSRGPLLWLYEQPSDYYRRHLLLHEGTHGFMFSMFGSCGPFWYMEGVAEFLATHRWHAGRLTLGYMPRSRDEVPEWGRVRIIQDAVTARKALRLQAVVDSPSTGERDKASYAWRWAVVTLLDRHPRYQQRFRQLLQFVRDADFDRRFYKLFEPDWQPLCEEWQLMVVNLEYGYDVARSAVDFTPGKPSHGSPRPLGEGQWHSSSPRPLGEGQGVRAGSAANLADSTSLPDTSISLAADRGWQNSGLRLEAGTSYVLTASGRYQIARQAKHVQPAGKHSDAAANAAPDGAIWWCEPGGVTIRYYHGQPLGILLAAVRPDQPKPGSTTPLLHASVIGLAATLTPKESGTLFLKVNDSTGELDDNAGELKVEIRPIAK